MGRCVHASLGFGNFPTSLEPRQSGLIARSWACLVAEQPIAPINRSLRLWARAPRHTEPALRLRRSQLVVPCSLDSAQKKRPVDRRRALRPEGIGRASALYRAILVFLEIAQLPHIVALPLHDEPDFVAHADHPFLALAPLARCVTQRDRKSFAYDQQIALLAKIHVKHRHGPPSQDQHSADRIDHGVARMQQQRGFSRQTALHPMILCDLARLRRSGSSGSVP